MLLRGLCVAPLMLSGAYTAQITTTTRESINGIGASGAWWVNDVALFPAEVRQNISELLLNQNSVVWVLALGDRAPETPYISDDVYNWSADAADTFFLKEAACHGIPIITLFVNSAPTAMTNNSENCGGTLITERILAYVQYLADVISYWKTQGVDIAHVSSMKQVSALVCLRNFRADLPASHASEPDNNFDDGDPTTLCAQEGMQVVPEQRAELVMTLAAILKAAVRTST
ncbi:hypothetical protein EVJ58_g4069 [Rhodofomes roseus]|uniref:Uncharacterized protein n=1 Tax=Rhodofomes roseus TaxID=34475 RepID=A0A4Y9YMB0_9APHY|nr:hypothetical protein EVJ58_g4069 [Rhodofomes roseus]